MYLEDIIAEMKQLPREHPMKIGFTHAHSYRGYYNHLAVEPIANSTVGESLDVLQGAIGTTFVGYKGGEYKMDQYVKVYISLYGCGDGDEIGRLLLAYLLGRDPFVVMADKIEQAWPRHVQRSHGS